MSLFIGITGLALQDEDIQRIKHPNCSGVILFTRNYKNKPQLQELIAAIRAVKQDVIISVDHEGGRVQRFVEGFTKIPAMSQCGDLFDRQPLQAYALAKAIGVIIAYELRQMDIDFSYTPVLDLRNTISTIINDRAFHENPAIVSLLASALRKGLRSMGMPAIGKHYPGHGNLVADSHLELPHDQRSALEQTQDRLPFFAQIDDGIEAIMTAHIILGDDQLPVTFSHSHLQVLRDYGFDGLIISDDLDMAGAQIIKEPAKRAMASYEAGADIAMLCNNFADMDAILTNCPFPAQDRVYQRRLSLLRASCLPENAEQIYDAALKSLQEFHVNS